MKCDFCGMNKDLITGATVNICFDCFKIIQENTDVQGQVFEKETSKEPFQMKAYELAEKLDEYIIGQDEAKRILSVAVCNHYKRIKMNGEIQKSNVLMVGPTGSGKTYIMETLAKILKLPLVIVDATTFTEVGYVGEDVSNVLKKLYYAADKDIELAQRGIVYVDEVDKIASKSSEGKRDVNGTGVQQSFLRIMDGGKSTFVEKEMGNVESETSIDTSNILFVFGGAFIGLEKVVEERLHINKKTMGFSATSTTATTEKVNIIKEITQGDLIKFGFIPEFMGRIPIIAPIEKLDKNSLKNILTKPKSALTKQYAKLMKADGISISFEDEAIQYIVDEAEKKNLGARGLKGILDKPMSILMFDAPKHKNLKELKITKELLQNPQILKEVRKM